MIHWDAVATIALATTIGIVCAIVAILGIFQVADWVSAFRKRNSQD